MRRNDHFPLATFNDATSLRLAEAILAIANESVTYVRLSGRRSVISRFEAVLIQLAGGQIAGRKAKTAFIETVLDAARWLDRYERSRILTAAPLKAAIETASDDEVEAELDRYLGALPMIDELSDREIQKQAGNVHRIRGNFGR